MVVVDNQEELKGIDLDEPTFTRLVATHRLEYGSLPCPNHLHRKCM